nr:sigma-54 dependent transcriptional regulator [Dyella ginsengisoli]
MLGHSPAFAQACELLRQYAACDMHVLIEGETGTGKELAAREIHQAGAGADCPFVAVNCGALPDTLVENELFGHQRGAYTDARCAQTGLVERAEHGTLFLDEIDTLSSKAQAVLLRFLETHECRRVGDNKSRVINTRVISATNARLEEKVATGQFRRDLHYRLNVLHVQLPPLRERRGDVPLLANHFLQATANRMNRPPKRWSVDALDALERYHWPGNVRELEHVVLRAFLRAKSEVIAHEALDRLIAEPAGASEAARMPHKDESFAEAKRHAIRAFELGYLVRLMERTHGNVTAAARLSGTERRQLGKLLQKHGIFTERFRCDTSA